MKTVLGLDLGSSSVGWAIAEFGKDSAKIVDMGSRIIPLTPDDDSQFTKGQAITKNADRTDKRTIRKSYDRRQQRRDKLVKELAALGITPAVIEKPIDLWALRSKAASEQVSLDELGRVLVHLNHKRGYRSGKDDFNDSTKSKYVKAVNERFLELEQSGLTLGQYFYKELLKDGAFQVKKKVYPRIAYINEFDRIIECQKVFYPDILLDKVIKTLKEETIFYQRKLKSCKHLVSVCEFEKREYTKADGTTIYSGPHVAPKSSPVSQLCKIWEFVNTISITDKSGDKLFINPEKKRQIADYLSCNETISITALQKILGLKKNDGWWIDKTISKRKVGNSTLIRIAKALNGKYDSLLTFNIVLDETVNKETGEVIPVISETIKTEPLFRLWHTLYSISEEEELRSVLSNKFGINDEEVLSNLCKIDFVKDGYANKSNTAMRKILPHLMEGFVYSDACAMAGYNHSGSVTKEENLSRHLATKLQPIKKGEMRQPIVEKILNQTINVVNSLNVTYGPFDEIRVELARELKQSREEREKTTRSISRNEKENARIAQWISEDYCLTPTKNRILKAKLWEETGHRCIYCGQPVNVTEFLTGIDVEKEHIIPRSLLFDNSNSNVTCACRKCNQEKGNKTAYDFMKAKSESDFNDYIDRVNALFEKESIGKAKRDKLLMSEKDIPQDFIQRQLRETQYVSKKALELLKEICYNVYATSGSVTDFVRHTWGWDNILHDLHFEQYKAVGLTSTKEIQTEGNVKYVERINDWSKRLDHRHHAIDALAIACTSQSMIQQLNTLNTLKDTPFKSVDFQGEEFKERHTRLEKYVLAQPHFTVAEVKEATEKIIISFKSGKKVTTPGKRYTYKGGKRTLQQRVLVPRGALSEQTVYGKIMHEGKEWVVVKYDIEGIDAKKAVNIVDEGIKKIVLDHLKANGGKITDKHPLDHQGRAINSVRMYTGLDAVVPVKFNEKGEAIGFVKPGNNHHVAIYVDKKGKYHESVVTFWHAVERKQHGLPVIIKDPALVFDNLPENLSDSFICQLPSPDWVFVQSLQANEMFVLGMPEEDFNNAIKDNDFTAISKYLYRVQNISSLFYTFRHHLETSVDDKYNGKSNPDISIKTGKLVRIRSLKALVEGNVHKMKINNLGKIRND